MSNIKLTICKKICGQCPFKTTSLQGYLDYHTTDEILESLQLEVPFSCHLQRKDDMNTNWKEVENGTQNVCRGYIAMASKSCKLFGQHPIYGKEMLRLQKEINEEDKKEVFNKWDWKKYHEK